MISYDNMAPQKKHLQVIFKSQLSPSVVQNKPSKPRNFDTNLPGKDDEIVDIVQ